MSTDAPNDVPAPRAGSEAVRGAQTPVAALAGARAAGQGVGEAVAELREEVGASSDAEYLRYVAGHIRARDDALGQVAARIVDEIATRLADAERARGEAEADAGRLERELREITETCQAAGVSAVIGSALGYVRALAATLRARVAVVEGEATEMRDALRAIGVFRSDEAGDDGSEWCVTLEPRGEEPAGSLVDALHRTMDAAENDGRVEPWLDAETAPRTGEHILVTRLGERGFGYTDGAPQDWCAVVHYWSNPGEEGFYLSSGASSEFDDHPVPITHWRPLDRAARGATPTEAQP